VKTGAEFSRRGNAMEWTKALAESWNQNAGNWTRAVRESLIPSRKAGTDDAIVSAIVSRRPSRMLDVGCGEGWLIRRVAQTIKCRAVGIDGSAQLIEDAKAADPISQYRVMNYAELTNDASPLDNDFDVAVFNYSLFDEDAAKLLAAVKPLLARSGVVIIQTLHPCRCRRTRLIRMDGELRISLRSRIRIGRRCRGTSARWNHGMAWCGRPASRSSS